jgi:uncharacterized protein (TIGR02270 family)
MPELQAALPAPLWSLVEESLDEAAFLWSQWEDALLTHAHDLASVSFWIEERLLGAVDGLRAGGAPALDPLLIPALGGDDGLRATAAAHAIAGEAEAAGMAALIEAWRGAGPERLAALQRALELTPIDPAPGPGKGGSWERFERALDGAGPGARAALLDAQAFQGLAPRRAIAEGVASGHPGLQAAALRALRHTPVVPGLPAVESYLDAPDRTVRDAAIETGLIQGSPSAWTRCQELLAAPAPGDGGALLLGALLGPERVQPKLAAAAANPQLRGQALFALGFAGTRAAAEICLEAMADEELAQLAGEAFCAISGLDLAAEKLIVREAEPEEPIPFESEDLDADLVPRPEDRLPRPDRAGVIRWWNAQRGRFTAGQRYVGGHPVSLAALQAVLLRGPMRRRHAVALELAVRTAGGYQVSTRAFSRAQRRQMAAFDRLDATALRRLPLARSFSPL